MKNILVTTYFSYKDPLIQTYTLPYLKIIHDYLPKGSIIYLVTFEQSPHIMNEEEMMEVKKELSHFGIELIPFNYVRFSSKAITLWFKVLTKLLHLCKEKDISYVHGWCTTGGAIAYIISRIKKIPLIIDSYEPHAEAMVENGTRKKGIAFKLLFYLEKKLSERAKVLIAATEGMREYAHTKYSVQKEHFYVKPACVNLDQFTDHNLKKKELLSELALEDKIICVYAGKFGGIYLEKEVFDFFKCCADFWKDKFRVLLLTSHDKNSIETLAKKSGLDPSIIRVKFVPHHQIADYLGLGDFAITPVKPIPTKRYCTPIKNGEYWALGLPVVIPANISDDSDIIKKYQIGAILNEFNEENYQNAISTINSLLTGYEKKYLYDKIRTIAKKYRSYNIANIIYKKIYSEASYY